MLSSFLGDNGPTMVAFPSYDVVDDTLRVDNNNINVFELGGIEKVHWSCVRVSSQKETSRPTSIPVSRWAAGLVTISGRRARLLRLLLRSCLV